MLVQGKVYSRQDRRRITLERAKAIAKRSGLSRRHMFKLRTNLMKEFQFLEVQK